MPNISYMIHASSAIIFILVAEVMACKIRENDNIKGFKTNDMNEKKNIYDTCIKSVKNGIFEKCLRFCSYFEVTNSHGKNHDSSYNLWRNHKHFFSSPSVLLGIHTSQ